MWKVLIIDDRADYVQSQIELAGIMGIDLIHIDNWEVAQKLLEKNEEAFDCIIIDGKGKLKPGGKEEDVKHLNKALNWLNEQKGRGNYYYYVINTAFAEQINNLVDGEPVYGKFGEEKKMFDDILKNILNGDKQKIRIKYADVFEVFEKNLLDAKTESQLIKIIQDCEKHRSEDIKGILSNIRAVQEAIYNSLQSPRFNIIPKEISVFNQKNQHLDGNPTYDNGKPTPSTYVYQNQAISSLNKTTYWVAGRYIHTVPDEIYFISNYTTTALLFSLFELLLWYKSIAKNHLKN